MNPRVIFSGKFLALVTVAFVGAVWAHEFEDGKGINNSAGAGIGGNGPWDSQNITLLSRVPLADMGGGPSNVLGNDLWGWTDPLTNREYAIVGLTNGTSFVDITNPYDPKFLGKLPSQTGNTAWRDMKVCDDHVYIVSDNNGNHGMQIFDLTLLRNVDPQQPQTFSNSGFYGGFSEAHNIVINEDTGYAYVVGSEFANGGLVIFDLQNPTAPTYVGQFSADGYTHDAQVVTYHGPDAPYAGREIAFNSNEDTLTIVDVTNKSNCVQISRKGYSGSEYSHQGWLSDDHRFFYMNDELDEYFASGTIPTRTRVWDVQDLNNPIYLGYHNGQAQTIDHNLYVKGDFIYQANYTSGLRVLKVNNTASMDIEEYGFFDTYNSDNAISFNGAWSVYPYFKSGSIIVNDRQNGLFVVRMNHLEAFPDGLTVTEGNLLNGGINELAVSDDFKVRISSSESRTSSIEIEGTSPFESPSEITLTLERNITTTHGNVLQTVELYNYTSNAWQAFSTQQTNLQGDSRYVANVSINADEFVNQNTGRMRARISFYQPRQPGQNDTLLIRNRYVYSIDRLTWFVGE